MTDLAGKPDGLGKLKESDKQGKRRFELLALGSAIVDVIVTSDDSSIDRLGLTKGQMALVGDARSGEIIDSVGSGVKSCGGSAANTAIGFSMLGGSSAFIGKIADDHLGEMFAKGMDNYGVKFFPVTTVAVSSIDGSRKDRLHQDSDRSVSTGSCVVLATPDGERTMATNLGAASTLVSDEIDATLASDCAVFYVEAYLLDIPAAISGITNAMEQARRSGNKVALSLSDKSCVVRHRAELLQFISGYVDILFGNSSEFTTLFSVSNIAKAAEEAAASGITAALTAGDKGSLVVSPAGQIFDIDAVPAERVVDSTGAGDIFAAGFLYGLLHGGNLVDCARLGSVCASETVTHLGSTPKKDLRALAEDNGALIGEYSSPK